MHAIAKSRGFRALAVLALAGAAFVAYQTLGWARFDGRVNRLALDLARPDGVVLTQSLSRLPRDLLRVPLLRDLLREDFVFFYEHNEDRLGLSGSLRRIAYEHKLQWNDRLVDWVLDEPAEVALWHDAKGAVQYYLISLGRNQLARLIQETATVALKDSQLTLATHLLVAGDRVPVYALSYGRDRVLLFAARGNRVVLLSDPGMLLNAANKADPKAEAVLARLLSGDPKEQRVYQQAFGLGAAQADHRIALSARYLSFGYQHFFPGIEALRFDFGNGQWNTAARFAPNRPVEGRAPATARALPARPAACAWVPVSWPMLEGFAAKAKDAPAVLPRFAGAGAVCWYARSSLDMPLFVAELAEEPTPAADQALQGLFAWALRGAPVEASAPKGTQLWQRRVAAAAPARESGEGDVLPTLARRGRLVIFSPDDKLARLALETLERRYPSVADAAPLERGGQTLALFTPKALSDLTRQAVFAVLPRGEQPVLHDAARTHLTPRLDALEKYPAFRLVLPSGPAAADGWREVRWEALSARP